jgi:hypothetical protein
MAASTPDKLKLMSDVRLLPAIAGWNPAEHLRINGGSLIARRSRFDFTPGDWVKEETNWPDGVIGSYHPKDDWRPLSDDELTSVLGTTDGTDYWNTVQLIALPEQLLQEARVFCSEAVKSGKTVTNAIDCQTVIGPDLGSLLENLDAWIFGSICEPVHWMLPEMRISPLGRISSTGGEGRGYNGLHIDGWGGSAEDQATRVYNGSRIITNIGLETRHLIYINLRATKIVSQKLTGLDPNRAAAFACAERGTGLLGAAFVEAFPDYPVIRVPIAPGQGYIAPTTAILHDGDLRGMQQSDVILLLPHAPGIGPQRAAGPLLQSDVILLLPHAPGIGPQRAAGPLLRPGWIARLSEAQGNIAAAARRTCCFTA